jgi:hypothetical protein
MKALSSIVSNELNSENMEKFAHAAKLELGKADRKLRTLVRRHPIAFAGLSFGLGVVAHMIVKNNLLKTKA